MLAFQWKGDVGDNLKELMRIIRKATRTLEGMDHIEAVYSDTGVLG